MLGGKGKKVEKESDSAEDFDYGSAYPAGSDEENGFSVDNLAEMSTSGVPPKGVGKEMKGVGSKDHSKEFEKDDEDDDDDAPRCCGIKLTNLSRLFKVFLAFPFVVIVAAIRPSGRYAFLRNIGVIRFMNMMIYIIPFFLTSYVLSVYHSPTIQIATVAAYMSMYLFPVAFVVFSKIDIVKASANIEDGTFCFKPARTVRFTEANIYQLIGFFFEWVQHVLYVLPVGVLTGQKQARIQDYPPYLPFSVYFWTCIVSVFVCCIILILNAVLRGRAHYRFQKTGWIWYILFNIGQPMFMTICTILFQGLWCDYDVDPPTLSQDPKVLCYSHEHIVMVRAGLMALALYVVQHTLLPSGTFKETMGDDTLEIMFVPIYMSAHLLLKAVFCGIYVFFYTNNMMRIWVLTCINLLILWVNNNMNPCSIGWVNMLRSTIFLHACLSGIQSINYVFWPSPADLAKLTLNTSRLLVSTLASNIFFTSVAVWALYWYNARGTEHSIAIAFLDLEWQVTHGGTVQPRVLEPLISLTLSSDKADWEIVKNYTEKLVWLISHKYTRVQFQAAWAIANLALLDEDARLKIHQHGGTRTLLEWYNEMDDLVQLESLAALGNLSLSYEVSEAMVLKHKCIPFFLQIIAGTKVKHSHFALVSLGNISRIEEFRDMIVTSGGMHVLVGCVMSRDYLKTKFASQGLANLLLNVTPEIEEAMTVQGCIARIIKIAARNEADTQIEVMALLRNLSCHVSMREELLKRGILAALDKTKNSTYDRVAEWSAEIKEHMDAHISSRQGQDTELNENGTPHRPSYIALAEESKKSELYRVLQKMEPLEGRVEWSTWGSKLDAIFLPIFDNVPVISSQHLHTFSDSPIAVRLSAGVPPAVLTNWKENLEFFVLNPPTHGTLNGMNTKSEFLTYTPEDGFVGTDLFTYRAEMGTLHTVPATVTISIDGNILSESGGSSYNDPTSNTGLTKRNTGGSYTGSPLHSGNRKNLSDNKDDKGFTMGDGLELYDTNAYGARVKRGSTFGFDRSDILGGGGMFDSGENGATGHKKLVSSFKLDPKKMDELEAVFDTLDVDKSGALDKSELRLALENTDIRLTKSELNAFFEIADADGNGEIDREEWVRAIQYGGAANVAPPPPAPGPAPPTSSSSSSSGVHRSHDSVGHSSDSANPLSRPKSGGHSSNKDKDGHGHKKSSSSSSRSSHNSHSHSSAKKKEEDGETSKKIAPPPPGPPRAAPPPPGPPAGGNRPPPPAPGGVKPPPRRDIL